MIKKFYEFNKKPINIISLKKYLWTFPIDKKLAWFNSSFLQISSLAVLHRYLPCTKSQHALQYIQRQLQLYAWFTYPRNGDPEGSPTKMRNSRDTGPKIWRIFDPDSSLFRYLSTVHFLS